MCVRALLQGGGEKGGQGGGGGGNANLIAATQPNFVDVFHESLENLYLVHIANNTYQRSDLKCTLKYSERREMSKAQTFSASSRYINTVHSTYTYVMCVCVCVCVCVVYANS